MMLRLLIGLACCTACTEALRIRVSTVHRCTSIRCSSSSPKNDGNDMNPATKAVWFATEAFGKAAALLKGNDGQQQVPERAKVAPQSLDDAIRRLAADYEGTADDPRPYFLTGRMDIALYAADCEFADPFVSFKGRDRFVENLENLAGGFITESSTRTLSTSTAAGDSAAGVPPSYTTKLLVKLRLGLPWSPVLAWPWGVTHEFDPESGLIVRHVESWDVSAAEGVKVSPSPATSQAHTLACMVGSSPCLRVP